MMFNPSSSKPSFTLVELLVVIAIIGILAAAVIFGVSNARDKAAQARAMSDCNTFVTGEQAYYADNGEFETKGAQCKDGGQCCKVTGYSPLLTAPQGWRYQCNVSLTGGTFRFRACKSSAASCSGATGEILGEQNGCKIL